MLNISITKTLCPKEKPDSATLGFGKKFTDHMLIVDYSHEKGWYNARIIPFANLSLHINARSDLRMEKSPDISPRIRSRRRAREC